MRTLKGAEWLEIAKGNWHWSPGAYAREHVACSLICLSREAIPVRISIKIAIVTDITKFGCFLFAFAIDL